MTGTPGCGGGRCMRIGKLNTLVVVERQDEDHGLGIKRQWKPTGMKLWVHVEQLAGMELMAAQQIEARANLKLTTHWQPDIRASDRLVTADGSRTFNIVTADNVHNQNRELELTCIEVVK